MYDVTMHFPGYKKWNQITESVGEKKKEITLKESLRQ